MGVSPFLSVSTEGMPELLEVSGESVVSYSQSTHTVEAPLNWVAGFMSWQ